MPMSKGKTAFNAILFVALLFGGLIALNVVGSRFFRRLDLTEDKMYTLSLASKNLVKDLPDRMNVKLFMSEDLPLESKKQAKFARDLLSEYAVASNGKLHFEVIKVKSGEDKTDTTEEEARKNGIQKEQRGVISKNKYEIGKTYLGVSFTYVDKTEAIPVLERAEGLEYAVSNLIKQLTVKKKKVALFEDESAQAGPRPQPNGPRNQVFRQLAQQAGYDVANVDLKAAIPKDVDALFVIAPQQKFNERAKYVIDQFLMAGKGVAFFLQGQHLASPKGNGMEMMGMEMPKIVQPNDVDLNDLLEFYGFRPKNDLVLDMQNYIGFVQMGQQWAMINHPIFLMAGPISQGHPVMQGIRGLVFPYAGSVELVSGAKEKQPGLQYVALAHSSSQSWRPSVPYVFDPEKREISMGPDKGPFALAYAAEGKMRSFFAGKHVVREDGSAVDSNQSVPGVEPLLVESNGKGRLVVVADAFFMDDQTLQFASRTLRAQNLGGYMGGIQLAQNTLDWLAEDPLLTAVRNKSAQNRPLKDVGSGTVVAIKAFNMAGLPVLVCLVGLMLWSMRNRRRKLATVQRIFSKSSGE